jgi:Tfp pilus assembly protein PilN
MKPVNLLSPDLRGAPKATAAVRARTDVSRGPGAFIVLGVLAFGVAALVGYVLTTNTIKQRQSETAQLSVRQQAAESRAAALKPYAEFQQLANSRMATLKDLAGQRFDWDQTLRDLSRALPKDVTINSLDGSLSGSDSTGASTSATDAAGPSITLSGCTASQSAVARLMARLHDVNGVTSVSLASSTKKETAAAATAPSETSSGDNAAPCGHGRRPDFKVVLHFERSAAVAASAGSGAPAAAPAAQANAAAAGQAPSATPTPTSGSQASSGATQTSSTSTTQGGAR